MNWFLAIGIAAVALIALLTALNAGELRTEFRDRNGHYQGSSLTNRYGTTSYYDRNGHFVGTETRHK